MIQGDYKVNDKAFGFIVFFISINLGLQFQPYIDELDNSIVAKVIEQSGEIRLSFV